MTKLTSKGAPKPVEVRFKYYVRPQWVAAQIELLGVEPSREFFITINLRDDVDDPDLRRRLVAAHHAYYELPGYPLLDEPTDDPVTFTDAIEGWIEAVRSGTFDESDEGDRSDTFETARDAWIREFGSQRLRMANDRGYKVNTSYARERCRQELPGFWLDSSDLADWKERVDPSEEGLIAERRVMARLNALGHQEADTRLVWLTEPPRELADWLDTVNESFEETEAIVIVDYLGRYVAVMPDGYAFPSEGAEEGAISET